METNPAEALQLVRDELQHAPGNERLLALQAGIAGQISERTLEQSRAEYMTRAHEALSAGRYLRHDYRVGQEIAFGDVRGRITRIHSTNTLLDAGEGRSIRVPNHLLIDSVVTVFADEPGGTPGAP